MKKTICVIMVGLLQAFPIMSDLKQMEVRSGAEPIHIVNKDRITVRLYNHLLSLLTNPKNSWELVMTGDKKNNIKFALKEHIKGSKGSIIIPINLKIMKIPVFDLEGGKKILRKSNAIKY